MRPPCFYHVAYVIHYEDPHHLFLNSYEDEAPLNLALVTGSLTEAPAFYNFFEANINYEAPIVYFNFI